MLLYQPITAGQALIQEIHGDFTVAPPGWKEISDRELAFTRWIAWSPDYTGWAQFMIDEKTRASVRLFFFFFDRTGVGLSLSHSAPHVRWFRFGCEHDYKQTSSRGFEHTVTCKKCTHEWSYDSSG